MNFKLNFSGNNYEIPLIDCRVYNQGSDVTELYAERWFKDRMNQQGLEDLVFFDKLQEDFTLERGEFIFTARSTELFSKGIKPTTAFHMASKYSFLRNDGFKVYTISEDIVNIGKINFNLYRINN